MGHTDEESNIPTNRHLDSAYAELVRSKDLLFYVEHPGEWAAGIRGFADKITIIIDSGDPGGDPGEFREHMRQALAEWYDGAVVK